MQKQLIVDSKKCIGCKSCELACSLANERELNPAKARIKSMTFLEGKYSLPYNFVTTCRQCEDAPCLHSCPVEAISRPQDRPNVIAIDQNRCIGCGKCMGACPFGSIAFAKAKKKVFKCELCSGTPACAAICPTGAIIFAEVASFSAKAEDCAIQAYMVLAKRNRKNMKDKCCAD
jgi:anaerobic carbon-monoxide dehydrogenase iron sulfur subunit